MSLLVNNGLMWLCFFVVTFSLCVDSVDMSDEIEGGVAGSGRTLCDSSALAGRCELMMNSPAEDQGTLFLNDE